MECQLVLKFPYGVLSFVVMVTLVSISLSFVLAPLFYLVANWLFAGWSAMGHNAICHHPSIGGEGRSH